jgi:hypothetical protein
VEMESILRGPLGFLPINNLNKYMTFKSSSYPEWAKLDMKVIHNSERAISPLE